MPLTKVDLAPGFNKQVTQTGAEGRWTDGDFVRFRYGLPEKIGGWEQILEGTLIGAAREQFVWADLDGRRYAAIGTNKILAIYYEGAFFDITPLGGSNNNINIALQSNDMTTVSMDDLINDLDVKGWINGSLNVSNQSTTQQPTTTAAAYISLLGKGWAITI